MLMPAVKNHEQSHLNIAEAHKNCIKRAINNNLDRVIIMEDDVMFVVPGAYKRFLELSETLPRNWDIFSSGSYDYQKAETYSDTIVRVTSLSGLHCYMVNKRYYNRFLETSTKSHLDKLLRGSLYMASPMLALQHDTYSDNVKRVTTYNKTHLKDKNVWKGH